MEEKPFIDWDIEKVKQLKDEYTENMALIREFLPPINWDSPKAVKNFFADTLEIPLENVRITTLARIMESLDHTSEKFDIVNGYHMYLRQKFTISNYIDCILRHQESGRTYLRYHEGQWVLQNKRPLSGSPEIRECIRHSEGV